MIVVLGVLGLFTAPLCMIGDYPRSLDAPSFSPVVERDLPRVGMRHLQRRPVGPVGRHRRLRQRHLRRSVGVDVARAGGSYRAGLADHRAARSGRQSERGQLSAGVPVGRRGGDRHRHVPIDLPHCGVPHAPRHPVQPRPGLGTGQRGIELVGLGVDHRGQPFAAQQRESGPAGLGRARQQPRGRHQEADRPPRLGPRPVRQHRCAPRARRWPTARGRGDRAVHRPSTHVAPTRMGGAGRRSGPGRHGAHRADPRRDGGSPTVR